MQTIDVSVVVPTRNERENIEPLIDRLGAALPPGRSELIFVDDSTDDTPEVAAAAGRSTTLPVLVVHRSPDEQVGGLGGAVVAGMRLAEGRIVVVMDGDLQHPPEKIPELIRPIDLGEADLVVASRYRDNGAAEGLGNRSRAGVSKLATRLTKAAFPRRLQEITDPMSGFFAVKASVADVDALRPVGFKILLEAVARCRLRVAEIGFSFAPRNAGESKAGVREGLRFARHLALLRVGTLLGERQRRAIGFAAVGATGLVVNALAFWAMTRFAQVPYLWAAVLSTQVSTTWNFAGMELFVFSDRKSGNIWGRYLRFSVLNNSVMLARLPLLAFLVSVLHTPQTLANVITLVAVFLVRFGISDRFIYEGGAEMTGETRASDVVGPVRITVDDAAIGRRAPKVREAAAFRYRYDLHGIVSIGSDVVLPELAYFRAERKDGDPRPDIGIRIGPVGAPRFRTRMLRSSDGRSIRWEEHLGRLSANFAIKFGDDHIAVTSSRALARSPHVLYTNVIEAVLRFVFVDRGYMLLHAACMEIDGRGLMLSAKTDTGKTGTVLKLLRTSEGRFLADDMTIVDSSGVARSFPKPLTISEHTLRAVDAGDLSRSEWARLRIQSRLHSKEGRGFAMKLADHNVPIMTINGWTQRAVPPPKYPVQRLVDCELTSETSIDQLYIIERGSPHHSPVPKAQAMVELLENTEDAYGFPPYRYLAQALNVGGQSYDELREQERLILASAMESVHIHRLGSDDFTWADRITAELRPRTRRAAPPFLTGSNSAANSQDAYVLDRRNVPDGKHLPGPDA